MSAQAFIFNPKDDRLAAVGVGFQVPRLTTAQRTALTVGPGDAGLLVFDLGFALFYGWDGSGWVAVSSGSGGGVLLSGIGDPNGVVTAPLASIYFDMTNPATPVQYVKTTAAGNVGWI